MKTDVLGKPTVRAAIEAFQRGDRAAWSAQFERQAELFDAGSPRSLTFAEEAPIFLVVFAVPAAVALALWWKLSERPVAGQDVV